MTTWTPICRVDDIPRLGARRVARAQGLDVAIFRSADDQIFALLNWNIGLCTGQAAAPDEGCTPKFAVKVENGQVFLDADELARHATTETRPVAGPVGRLVVA